jgi:dienelactone hydrolase
VVAGAEVPGGELFVCPGSGHLFADRGHPDYDDAAARLAGARVIDFLASL